LPRALIGAGSNGIPFGLKIFYGNLFLDDLDLANLGPDILGATDIFHGLVDYVVFLPVHSFPVLREPLTLVQFTLQGLRCEIVSWERKVFYIVLVIVSELFNPDMLVLVSLVLVKVIVNFFLLSLKSFELFL
jgi:hypothetical protein